MEEEVDEVEGERRRHKFVCRLIKEAINLIALRSFVTDDASAEIRALFPCRSEVARISHGMITA